MIEAEFANIIQKIADERGKDIFLEQKKLKPLLLDYTKNEYKKESKLLLRILEADIVKIINTAEDLVNCKQGLVKRLEEDDGLSPSKSGEMLDLLFLVLRGKNIVLQYPENPNTQISNNSGQRLKLIDTFEGYDDAVFHVSFSPDSKYIVSGSGNDALKLWNIENGRFIRAFQENEKKYSWIEKRIYSASFSPDSKYIVSGGDNLNLWQIRDGSLIKTLQQDKQVYSVSFSPDGKYIVSGSMPHYRGGLELWSVENRAHIGSLDGHEDKVFSVSFSPDGKYIASGSFDKTVKLWKVEIERSGHNRYGWEEVKTHSVSLIGSYRHKEAVFSVSFSPNGKYIVSGSKDETLKLWDIKNGRILTLNGHKEAVRSVAFSPDGKYIVSGSWDKTLKLWDVNSGCCIEDISAHEGYVLSVSFSPDGKYIASGSGDCTMKLWSLE